MAGRCSKADAIVVLGCRNAAAMSRRLDRGIELFHKGAAPLLVLSGGGAGAVPEAEQMRRGALARGVPKAALLTETRSRDTVENAHEVASILTGRGLRSVLLVSDRTHLLRAAMLFRLAGLRVAAKSGVPALSLQRGAGTALREAAVLPWSLLQAVFRHRLSGPPGQHQAKGRRPLPNRRE